MVQGRLSMSHRLTRRWRGLELRASHGWWEVRFGDYIRGEGVADGGG